MFFHLDGRPFRFVYFDGGTPSFLSPKQLTKLADRLREHISWDGAEEVTGSKGKDYFYGGNGNDYFHSRAAESELNGDVYYGGVQELALPADGSDTVDYTYSSFGLSVNMAVWVMTSFLGFLATTRWKGGQARISFTGAVGLTSSVGIWATIPALAAEY